MNSQQQVKQDKSKRSIFRSLQLSMVSFGLAIGLVFPPFASWVLKSDKALTLTFFSMCLGAGLVVGAVNFLLFKVVVSREITRIRDAMNSIVGQIELADKQKHTISLEQRALEVTSDDQLGDIQHAFNNLSEAIVRRLQYEEASRHLYTSLSKSVELEQIAPVLLQLLCKLYDAPFGLMYGQIAERFDLLTNQGIDQHRGLPSHLNFQHGMVREAQLSTKPFTLEVSRDWEWLSISSPFGEMRPCMLTVVPLYSKQQVIGLALLAGPCKSLSTTEESILETVQVQGAAYLHNALLHKKLQDIAAIDDLTMILNRRFGLRRFSEEFSRSLRHGNPITAMLMDIDHFKSFNDTYGHDAGDVVLRRVARVLDEEVRAGDILCRYGGEEFLVVAPGLGALDARKLAERLRRQIETTQVIWEQQDLHVTISIGLATWPITTVSTGEELITKADEALYRAKADGRNCIRFETRSRAYLNAVDTAENPLLEGLEKNEFYLESLPEIESPSGRDT